MDVALYSLEDRFQTMENVRDTFGILLNFNDVATMSRSTVRKHCEDTEKALSKEGHADISVMEMAEEILNLPPLPSKSTAMELLKFLHQKKQQEIYPHLWIALRIAVTLPVTVAAAERSFSKLKLVKNYLRSTINKERLSGLALISINSEFAQQISYEAVNYDFA